MIIAYDNAVNSLTLSMSNESPLFPVGNLKDSRLSRFVKVLGTDTRIVFSGATTAVTALFIANHNLTSTAVVKLEGNTTNAWVTPAFTTTLTYNSHVMSKIITSASYAYWSVSIVDTANTEDVKIGGIFLGTYVTTNTFSHSLTNRIIDTTLQSVSLSGQVYTDVNHAYDEYDLHFPYLSLTDVTTLKAVQAKVKKAPLYFMLDETAVTEFNVLYCTMDDLSYSRVYNNFYTTDILLREAK